MVVSTLGGLALVLSALLFAFVLARAKRQAGTVEPFSFSLAVHMPARVPVALNGFGLWVAMMIALTVVNYGFPIVQLATLQGTSVPAIHVGEPR